MSYYLILEDRDLGSGLQALELGLGCEAWGSKASILSLSKPGPLVWGF